MSETRTQEITDAVGQLHGLQCAAHRHLLAFVAKCDADETWREDGAGSTAEWLACELHLALRTARDWVEVARALTRLPEIAATYEAGRLSFDQLKAVVRFATSETDATLAADAPGYNAAQLEAAARHARAITKEESEANHARRRLSFRWTHDETWVRISGRLPGDQGAIVMTALEHITDRAPAGAGGIHEAYEARLADALVAVCGTDLATQHDGHRATVIVHVDADTLQADAGSAEIGGGGVVGAEVARRIVCDARLQIALRSPAGTPLGIGRVSRTVPAWLGRQLHLRDRGCAWPGCGRKRFVNAHHLRHWSAGGRTDLDNLVLLCGFHHHLVHEGGWRIRGSPTTKLEFVRPDGDPLPTGPPRLRAEIHDRFFPQAVPV